MRWLVCVAALALATGAAAHGATPGTKTYFVLGQQLVGVDVAAATPRAAVEKLLAGPRARRGLRTFVPERTRLRSASRVGSTATVDLSASFASGRLDWRNARLAQLVYTVSSVRGVRSVLVRIEGQAPGPKVFPHLDLSLPLTRADIARPKTKLPSPPQPRLKPPSPAIRKLQQRLADLSFLPAADVSGRAGPETTFAVTGFQKWAGLSRDGVAGPATMRALTAAVRPMPIVAVAGRRIEVLLDRQLTLLEQGSQVVLTIPVSTGKGENATPPARSRSSARRSSPGRTRSRSGCHGRATSTAGSRSTSTRTCRHWRRPTAACASRSTGRSCSTASRRSGRRCVCSPARSERRRSSRLAKGPSRTSSVSPPCPRRRMEQTRYDCHSLRGARP